MPIKRDLYPPDWVAISRRIRFERAGGCCEWCGVAHGAVHPDTGSVVILTVAHLGVDLPDGSPGSKHDKMDVREENLAALCQRCHLNYDRDDHIVARRRNRLARIEVAALEAGQQVLRLEIA